MFQNLTEAQKIYSIDNTAGHVNWVELKSLLVTEELIDDFDAHGLNNFELVHRIFINARRNISRFRILSALKFHYKNLTTLSILGAQSN